MGSWDQKNPLWWIFPISDINQERIVQEGGLDALLKLLESSHNTTILRVASGAIANLAMNGTPHSIFHFHFNPQSNITPEFSWIHTCLYSETNQGLITKKAGAKLLANAASKTDDPQTLRMVAGAIANLCGNGKIWCMITQSLTLFVVIFNWHRFQKLHKIRPF